MEISKLKDTNGKKISISLPEKIKEVALNTLDSTFKALFSVSKVTFTEPMVESLGKYEFFQKNPARTKIAAAVLNMTITFGVIGTCYAGWQDMKGKTDFYNQPIAQGLIQRHQSENLKELDNILKLVELHTETKGFKISPETLTGLKEKAIELFNSTEKLRPIIAQIETLSAQQTFSKDEKVLQQISGEILEKVEQGLKLLPEEDKEAFKKEYDMERRSMF